MVRLSFLSGFQFFIGENDEQVVSEHQVKAVLSECMQNTARVTYMLLSPSLFIVNLKGFRECRVLECWTAAILPVSELRQYFVTFSVSVGGDVADKGAACRRNAGDT